MSGVRSLALVLAADCNLRCSYCYQDAKKARRMSWRTARRALDLLAASARSEVRLLFIGGEPLLHFGLVRRAVAHLKSHGRRGQAVRLAITTNGTLVGPREAAFLAKHDFELDVSFDGIPEAQQQRGSWTFSRLDRLLDRLRRDHAPFLAGRVTVNVTLLPSTVRHLSRSIDYLIAKGVANIVVAPVMKAPGEWPWERIAELELEVAHVYRRSLVHCRATGQIPVRFLRGARPVEDAMTPPSGWLCGAGAGECLAVDVDGEVFGCVMFARSYQRFPPTPLGQAMERLGLGHVRTAPLAARLATYESVMRECQVFDRREAKYSSYGRCAECESRQACALCPMAIVHRPHNTDPHRIPDFTCAFNRVTTKYARKFAEEVAKAA